MSSRRVRGLAVLVVGAGVVVAANVVAYGHDTQVDLSAAHRFTLSPETRALARAVHAPLRIRAFLASHPDFSLDDPAAPTLAATGLNASAGRREIGFTRTLPHRDRTAGFFIARLRRG